MEAYEQEGLASQSSPNSTPLAAESGSVAKPAQPTLTEQIVPPDYTPKNSRRIFIITTIAVAIVAAGLSGVLVYKLNSSNQSDCEIRYKNLTEEAKNKLTTLKSSLADYKKRVELCEQVNENAAADNGEILNLRLAGDNTTLYINREYRFAIRLPRTFVDQMATCEVNDGGAPVLSAGEGVPIAALQEAGTGNFYLVPAFHYETMNTDGQVGCYKIDHDVAWARGVSG
ncbi:hypothetical protein KKE28_01355, partial [Patescibacteria group bacterium]|nr:hypothetical protein [Patescibacteria group bacterium]